MAGARAILHALPTVQKMVVNFCAAALNTGYVFKEASFWVGSRALCWQFACALRNLKLCPDT